MNTTPKTARKSRRKCSSPQCRGKDGWGHLAVYRVGSDGFGAETGKLVCANYACTSWATKGYPVTLHAVNPA
jgi:hypothetical protein